MIRRSFALIFGLQAIEQAAHRLVLLPQNGNNLFFFSNNSLVQFVFLSIDWYTKRFTGFNFLSGLNQLMNRNAKYFRKTF